MKRFLLSAIVIPLFVISVHAQVGINNSDPKATLDVTAEKTDGTTSEGIIAPRLTGDQIKAKDARYGTEQTGVIVYATSAVGSPSTKTANITTTGYYYFDGTVWKTIGSTVKQQFYMPSIVIPTDPASLPNANYSYTTTAGGTFTVDLYNIYKQQYQYTTGGGAVRSLSGSTLKIFDADKLDFFVTYYDTDVFQYVAISITGILTYRLVSGYNITEKTFMNIMFQEK
jgi:hypothetical protein